MERDDLSRADALLDTLVPGDDLRWPSAASLRLLPAFLSEAAIAPGEAPFRSVLERLPAGFPSLTSAEREAVLAAAERDGAPLTEIAAAAYRAYYTHPDIAARTNALSRATG